MNKKPVNVYLDVRKGHGSKDRGQMAYVLQTILGWYGGIIAEKLVDGSIEATIAVTDDVSAANAMLEATRETVVVLFYSNEEDGQVAQALAQRFAERVFAPSLAGNAQENFGLVPLLIFAVAEMQEQK